MTTTVKKLIGLKTVSQGTALETISLVVPCYNEAQTINKFTEAVWPILEEIDHVRWEIVFVDDGSKDDTLAQLNELALRDMRVRVIGLSRNFGKEVALTAGIDIATGNALIPMDVDLQDPPSLLGEMVAKYLEGWPVVQAARKSRESDSWAKRTTARLFYKIMGKLTPFEVCPNVGDFQLLSRKVIEAIKLYPERTRFMKGITASVGFPRTKIYFDRQPRIDGETKFGFWKLWNFALEGITSFSTLPLRIWSYLGLLTAAVAFGWAAWLVFRTMYFGVVTPGYASIFASTLFVGGIQLLGIGVIGEYVGRISIESRQRPLYHIAHDSKLTPVNHRVRMVA